MTEDHDTRPHVVLRRPRSEGKFTPRPAAEGGVVVGRDLLSAARPTSPATTSRRRVQAGELPDWEPTPPGEQLVRRR